MKTTQDQIERAHEWTSEHYPDLEGTAYETKVREVLADIVAIDAAADRADQRCR